MCAGFCCGLWSSRRLGDPSSSAAVGIIVVETTVSPGFLAIVVAELAVGVVSSGPPISFLVLVIVVVTLMVRDHHSTKSACVKSPPNCSLTLRLSIPKGLRVSNILRSVPEWTVVRKRQSFPMTCFIDGKTRDMTPGSVRPTNKCIAFNFKGMQ